MAQDALARAAVASPRVRLMEWAREYRAYKHDLLAATERTLRVVETLETADHTAERSGKLA